MRKVLSVVAVRAKAGLTQNKFAKALRIPVSILQNWERGRTKPDPAALSLFALVDSDTKRAFKVLAGQ